MSLKTPIDKGFPPMNGIGFFFDAIPGIYFFSVQVPVSGFSSAGLPAHVVKAEEPILEIEMAAYAMAVRLRRLGHDAAANVHRVGTTGMKAATHRRSRG